MHLSSRVKLPTPLGSRGSIGRTFALDGHRLRSSSALDNIESRRISSRTRSSFLPLSSVPLAALMPQRVMRFVIRPHKKFPLARTATARPVTDKLCSNSLAALATSTLQSDRARASRPGPPGLALRALPESLHHSWSPPSICSAICVVA